MGGQCRRNRIDGVTVEYIIYGFEVGSSRFDSGHLRCVSRLLDVLEHNQDRIDSVEIVGYADAPGTTEFNRDVSLRRANRLHHHLMHHFDNSLPFGIAPVQGAGVHPDTLDAHVYRDLYRAVYLRVRFKGDVVTYLDETRIVGDVPVFRPSCEMLRTELRVARGLQQAWAISLQGMSGGAHVTDDQVFKPELRHFLNAMGAQGFGPREREQLWAWYRGEYGPNGGPNFLERNRGYISFLETELAQHTCDASQSYTHPAFDPQFQAIESAPRRLSPRQAPPPGVQE